MLFRVLAVFVWAFHAGMISNAAAALDGFTVNFIIFAFVLVTAALVQGYPAHIVNEIFDWQSGADRPLHPAERYSQPGRHASRNKNFSGGSKVIVTGLLTVRDLWHLFYFTTALVFALALFVAAVHAWKLLLFLVPGYFLCIFYSLPPFRFAYRPFFGEFFGGFAGIVLLVCGGYYAQSGILPLTVVVLAFGLGFMYAAIMVFFHYLDFGTDRLADPPKRTTVVFLGLQGSRIYACCCAIIGTAMLLYLSMTHHFLYSVLAIQGIVILYCHLRVHPDEASSVVFWGKMMTYFILSAGLIFAMAIEPRFTVMLPVYLIGFWAHKRFGKLPRKPHVVATAV